MTTTDTPRSARRHLAQGRSLTWITGAFPGGPVEQRIFDLFRDHFHGPDGTSIYLGYEVLNPATAHRGNIVAITDRADGAKFRYLLQGPGIVLTAERERFALESYHLNTNQLAGYARELQAVGLAHGPEQAADLALANAIAARIIDWSDVRGDLQWLLQHRIINPNHLPVKFAGRVASIGQATTEAQLTDLLKSAVLAILKEKS